MVIIYIIVITCNFFYFLEFGEESIIYSDVRFHCSSSIQKRKITRNFKTKGKNI